MTKSNFCSNNKWKVKMKTRFVTPVAPNFLVHSLYKGTRELTIQIGLSLTRASYVERPTLLKETFPTTLRLCTNKPRILPVKCVESYLEVIVTYTTTRNESTEIIDLVLMKINITSMLHLPHCLLLMGPRHVPRLTCLPRPWLVDHPRDSDITIFQFSLLRSIREGVQNKSG